MWSVPGSPQNSAECKGLYTVELFDVRSTGVVEDYGAILKGRADKAFIQTEECVTIRL